jgi:hypothetical protein
MGRWPIVEERWRESNEEENFKVYIRRQSRHEQQEIVELSNGETYTTTTPSNTRDSMDLHIALRTRAGKPTKRYSDEHDIANYVSYTSLSPSYGAFNSLLQSVLILRDWIAAKQDRSGMRP